MKTLDFWFDPISPYSYLAFERLPVAFEDVSYNVHYRPILFGALLKHWDHKGPAEIGPKRAWTYRQVLWFAHRDGVEMQMPLQHPFNPLALLRLAYACAGPDGLPNRRVCAALLRHVWRGGADANAADRIAALTHELAPRLDPNGADVKQQLRDATDRALALGVFGVPTIGVDDRLFWGFDGLEMVSAHLRGDAWFDPGGAWDEAGAPRAALQRPS